MKVVPVALAVGAAIFIGIPLIGSNLITPIAQPPHASQMLDDARAAIRLKELNRAEIKEVHILSPGGTVCGLITHKESKVGWAPFAYDHERGLSVAEVWGLGQPENLNKLYGCHFLPIAYTGEWKAPFWGGGGEVEYAAAPQAI